MTAHPGAFCTPPGNTDSTVKGTPMVCAVRAGGRARWGSDGGTDPRKALLKEARNLGVKIKRNTPAEQIRAQIDQATARPRGEGVAPATPQAPTPQAAATRPVHQQIEQAYQDLIDRPAGWVSLVKLRQALPQVSREDLDAALITMVHDGGAHLEPDPFGHRIGPDEKAAAIHLGGEDRHNLSIRAPRPPEVTAPPMTQEWFQQRSQVFDHRHPQTTQATRDGEPTTQEIYQAYRDAVTAEGNDPDRAEGAYTYIAAVRRRLPYHRRQVDTALRAFSRRAKVYFDPESNQKVLLPQHRDGALRLGADDDHLMLVQGKP